MHKPSRFQIMRKNRDRKPSPGRKSVLHKIAVAELEELRAEMREQQEVLERAFMRTLPDTDPYAAVMDGSAGATWAPAVGGMLMSQDLRNKLTRALLDPPPPRPRPWWSRLMFWRHG